MSRSDGSTQAGSFAADELFDFDDFCLGEHCSVEQPVPDPDASPLASLGNDPPADYSDISDLGTQAQEVEDDLQWLSRLLDDSFCELPPQLIPPATIPTPNVSRQSNTRLTETAYQPHRMTTGALAPAKAKRSSRARGSGWLRPASANKCPRMPRYIPPYPSTAVASSRRCSHCDSQQTPQWREGPEGAKTLCNACGMRYKSGHLLPEYRPALSPTYVSSIHSNSHRKVLEIRHKKEVAPTTIPLQQFLRGRMS